MNKKMYEVPVAEIAILTSLDVICDSGEGPTETPRDNF